jgi:hypothetical protein
VPVLADVGVDRCSRKVKKLVRLENVKRKMGDTKYEHTPCNNLAEREKTSPTPWGKTETSQNLIRV